jgi:hypothetical protein
VCECLRLSGSRRVDGVELAPLRCTTQTEWEMQVGKAVATLESKYSGLKRIDLMAVVRGPRNQGCPAPPAAGEYIAIPKEFDGALAGVAVKFPGLVFVGPKSRPLVAPRSSGDPT